MINTNLLANVKFKRRELVFHSHQYELIRDCLAGQHAVKNKGTKYLPQPNPADVSDENKLRYAAYILRALFLNATSRTLEGLVGQIFMRDPEIELPPDLEVLLDDVNGEGLTLIQFSKRATRYVLAYGRAGILTDYPPTAGGLTIADKDAGNIRPTIKLYEAWNCINWRTKIRGAKKILSLVVLVEEYDDENDAFEIQRNVRYRVLRLGKSPQNMVAGIIDDINVYTVEIWGGRNDAALSITESYQPVDVTGEYFDEIPFIFVGSENNDIDIDNSPLYDLANINIAHYRNSAEFEESCYIAGQPTFVFSGLTENWIKNVFKDKPIPVGSRSAVLLPEKGTASLLQADPNSMPEKGMERKEEQMVSIGAKLVQPSQIERTATEVTIDKSSETSILASSAKNVSDAIGQSLAWASKFVSSSKLEYTFRLSDDFDIAKMSPEGQRQLIANFQAGLITWTETRNILRRSDLVSEDDDEAKKQIDEMKAEAEAAELKKAEAASKINQNSQNNKNTVK